ncbi:MAG: HAMP domain-containing histidine kinase [Ruminococcaceae bacterium]|nr:HAMP domain-containing histidine kinase [Oscillospiraceae bacterium]
MKKLKTTKYLAIVTAAAVVFFYLAAAVTVTFMQARMYCDILQNEANDLHTYANGQVIRTGEWIIRNNDPEAVSDYQLQELAQLSWYLPYDCIIAGDGAVLRVENTYDGFVLNEVLNRTENFLQIYWIDENRESQSALIPLEKEQAIRMQVNQHFDRRTELRVTGVMDNGFLYPASIEGRNNYSLFDNDTEFRPFDGISFDNAELPKGELVEITAENYWVSARANGELINADTDRQIKHCTKTMKKSLEKADELREEMDRFIEMQYINNIDIGFSSRNIFKSYFVTTQFFPDYQCVTAEMLDSFEPYDADTSLLYVYMMAYSPIKAASSQLLYYYIFSAIFAITAWLILFYVLYERLGKPLANVALEAELKNSTEKYGNTCPELRSITKTLDDHRIERRQLQDEVTRLNKAVDYAAEAERSRREMTSAIAHELKTPLAIIHSYAEGINERIAEDKREHYLSVILDETERMDDMVVEMLDLSRLEAGKTKLNREDFSLSELAQGVFERLEKAVQAKELEIGFDVFGDCTVNADKKRIEQVITNFATNAVKYTPHGGFVNVRLRQRYASVVLAVENQSEPIDPEKLEKIWETFYRVDEARQRENGTGLGLAIAKSIIELHGGTVKAVNTTKGVEFSFEI